MSTPKKKPVSKKNVKIVRDAKGHFAKNPSSSKKTAKKPTTNKGKVSLKKPEDSDKESYPFKGWTFFDFGPHFPKPTDWFSEDFWNVINTWRKRMEEKRSAKDDMKSLPAEAFLSQLCKEVSEKDPQVLKINGKTFYSEGKVAKMLDDTIHTCANAAAKEVSKAVSGQPTPAPAPNVNAPVEKPTNETAASEKQKTKDAEIRKTAAKWSRFMAGCIMTLFCGSLIYGAVYGAVRFCQWLAR